MPAAPVAGLAVAVVFGATVAHACQQSQNLPGQVLAAAQRGRRTGSSVVTKTSYINLFVAPSPVQHYWSLVIEEQFYLVLPIVLLLLLLRKTRSPRVIGVVLGVAPRCCRPPG